MFFGTPELAVPTLERMLAGPHEVVAVVSQPDRPRGRGRRVTPSPVAQLAQRVGLPLLQPEPAAAKDSPLVDSLRSYEADLGVVVAFGQFLPKAVRQLPKLGYLINAHASLLPKYRGASPIARAILNGEEHTGVSVMRVEREMDAGPVALVRRLEIRPEENTGELSERLAETAADAIEAALEQVARDEIEWTEQEHAAASEAPKFEREDGRLDWRLSSEELLRRIRALTPNPGAFTTLNGQALRIQRAVHYPSLVPGGRGMPEATASEHSEGRPGPGTVTLHGNPPLTVATGDGFIAPLQVQRAGGRSLPIDAFLRGRAVADGTRLGEPAELDS